MASTATSSATAVLGGVRLPAVSTSAHRKPSLLLFPSPPCSFSKTAILVSDVQRLSSFKVKTSSEETSSSIQTDEILADLKQKWDSIENKSSVFVYGGGAIAGLWLSSILIGAINSVPLLPKLLELVGLGYTGWFVYRYLLFKSNRKELAEDIEYLKKKIAGTEIAE